MPSRVAQIGDLMLVAEFQLGTPAEELLRNTSLHSDPALAGLFTLFEEADPSPSPVEEAAMWTVWIFRHQPFPRDNQQIGYQFMCAMLDDIGKPWPKSGEDGPVIAAVFEALEAGAISEAEFVDWVCLRVEVGEPLRPPIA